MNHPATIVRTAALGLAALAAAMGIGRFAFTPLLPLMQQAHGLSLGAGAWLAGANYLGYLAGAVASWRFAPAPGRAARWGLAGVAASTLLMGATGSLAAWLALRFAAGVASSFVLVGAAAWALARLAALGRPQASGWVFAGVGIGIATAGLVALAGATAGVAPAAIWIALGVLAAAVAAAAWFSPMREAPAGAPGGAGAASRGSAAGASAGVAPALERDAWILVACYGLFGFGYIIPATFVPAAARALVDDVTVFGWVWPLFGLAAALSTWAVSALWRDAAPRRVAVLSLLVMALGVAAPALHGGLAALVVSAIGVGGTFMVMTMAGMQEARRLHPAAPQKLIAAQTAAFALGQLLGPLMIVSDDALAPASLLAAALLVASAFVLELSSPRRAAASPETRKEA